MATAKKAPTKAPAKKPIKPAAGRGQPTLYRPEYCEQVIEWGKEGKSKAQIAARLNICRQTLDNWTNDHPEFLDAITRARVQAQNWWEDKAQEGMLMPGFNASVWAKSMSARFPDDYTEKNKTELTGIDGAPISHSIEVAFVSRKG